MNREWPYIGFEQLKKVRDDADAIRAETAALLARTPLPLSDEDREDLAELRADVDLLRNAAAALLEHTSRTDHRRRNKLLADFQRAATPERVGAIAAVLDAVMEQNCGKSWLDAKAIQP